MSSGEFPPPPNEQLGGALTRWFTRQVRRRLVLALIASFALPWLVGEFAKQFVQPGLHNDATRTALMIDYMVIGAALFALTLVMTWLIGTWITAVMKGPQVEADAFPVDAPRPGSHEPD